MRWIVFGCVRSKSVAPGTSAVMTWISLPPSRRKSSSKDTAVPPLVGRNSSVTIRNGVFTGAEFKASECRDELGAESGIVAAVEPATTDEMDELGQALFHLVAIGVLGMRQNDRVLDVGDNDVRHDLLAAPLGPLVADGGSHLPGDRLHEFPLERAPCKAREARAAPHIVQGFEFPELVEVTLGDDLNVVLTLRYQFFRRVASLAHGFDL